MKFLFCIAVIFSTSVFSQKPADNFSGIDRKVKFITATNADSLAKQLSALGKTDREKVRAIFRWITEHIDYNVKIFNRHKRPNAAAMMYEEPDDSSAALPSLNERVAAKVLKRKTAFCDGYSRLFKTLCDYTGIRSEIIHGYARTNMSRSNRFGVNHTWNAVNIDNIWYLLDVTWASGFISPANEFVRYYDDYYFLPSPEDFIRDHYPEDIHWTLMADPPAYREFHNGPFRYSAFVKSGITFYYPAKGIIEAAAGDTIRLELKTESGVKKLLAAESPVTDSVFFASLPSSIVMGDKIVYMHTITGNAKNWLYVFYNDEVVLRYRLNIKKEKEPGTGKLAGLSPQ